MQLYTNESDILLITFTCQRHVMFTMETFFNWATKEPLLKLSGKPRCKIIFIFNFYYCIYCFYYGHFTIVNRTKCQLRRQELCVFLFFGNIRSWYREQPNFRSCSLQLKMQRLWRISRQLIEIQVYVIHI